MSWFLPLVILSSLLLGWSCGVWQCSKRKECPRYQHQALEKWKRSLGSRRARPTSPATPARDDDTPTAA